MNVLTTAVLTDGAFPDDLGGATDVTGPELDARLPWVDIALVGLSWLLLQTASLIDLGTPLFVLWIVVSSLAILRRVENGLVLLLTMSFGQIVAMTYYPMFRIMFAVIAFRALLDGRLGQMTHSVLRKPTFAAAGFVLICAISWLYAPDRQVADEYLVSHLKSLVYIVLVYALCLRLASCVVFLKALVIVAAGGVVVSVACGLAYEGLPLTLRTDAYVAAAPVERKVGLELQEARGYGANRWMPYGLDSNVWGAMMLFPLGAAIGLLGSSRSKRGRVLWGLAAGIIVLQILGSFSRASFLSMVLLGVWLLIRMRVRGIGPAILLGLAGLVTGLLLPFVVERITGIWTNIEETGGSGRFAIWAKVIAMWATSPVWGHGLGSILVSVTKVAHNTYLHVLAEQGVLGLVPYLIVLIVGIRGTLRSVRLARRTGDLRLRWLAEGCLAGLIAVMFNISSISVIFADQVWLAAALCTAMWTGLRQLTESATDQETAMAWSPGSAI